MTTHIPNAQILTDVAGEISYRFVIVILIIIIVFSIGNFLFTFAIILVCAILIFLKINNYNSQKNKHFTSTAFLLKHLQVFQN